MTTTDRELLELAAKAAGYDYAKHGGYIVVDGIPGNWNPLTDDGDALRLAVRLRLSIDHNYIADQQRWCAADRNGCEGVCAPVSAVEDEFDESDRATATRRVIVRAAAAIGNQMP